MTNLWAETSGNNCYLVSHVFVELCASTIGGLHKEVKDKFTIPNINTFFSEWSKVHEVGNMASVNKI